MPQLVDIPDVGTVEFPDDATLDEITQAANERFTKTVSARGMGNAFLREGQRGTGNLLEGAGAAVETLPDFGMMEPGVRNPAVQRQARDERARYATETPGQKLARIQRNPIYVAGQALEETAPETHPVPPQEENSFATKAAGMAGGFVPLVAAGAAGPAVIGLQSAGQHISSDFEQAKQQGLSDDAAAELALKRATESGTLQAGIFFALPAPVRAVAEKYLVAKLGEAGFMRWLGGRAAAAGEGALLGGGSKVAENVVSDRPATEGVAGSAAALGGMNLLLPWLREKENGEGRAESGGPGGPPETAPPGPAAGPVTAEQLADLKNTLVKNQIQQTRLEQALSEITKPKEQTVEEAAPEIRNAEPEAPTEELPTDLTAAAEPATKEVAAAPETSTVRTASDDQARTDERTGSEMTAETGEIPARAAAATSNEEGRTESAERGTNRRKPTKAEATRPWDIIDEFQGAHGNTISLQSARKIQEDFKPRGAARKIFSARGGMPIDEVVDAMRRNGTLPEDATEGDLLDAFNAAAEARKGWRKGVSAEQKLIQEEERQHVEFTQDIGKNSQRTEPIVPEDLNEGDQFTLRGAKLKVTRLEFDEDGRVTGVTLDDGKKYGTQHVGGETSLRMDRGSLKSENRRPKSEVGALREEPPAYRLDTPETVDQQKARLAREAADAKAKEDRVKLEQRAAKKLEGSRGDLGQKDLLGGGDLFSEEPGDPSLWHLPDNEIVDRLRYPEEPGFHNVEMEAKARGLIDKTRAEEEAGALRKREQKGEHEAERERETERREIQRRQQHRDNAGRDAGHTREPERQQPDLERTASAVQPAGPETKAPAGYADEVAAMNDRRLRMEVRLLEDDLRDATGPRSSNVFEGSHIPHENIPGIYSPEQLAEQARGRKILAERTRAKLEIADPELKRREAKARDELQKLRENPRWVELQRKREGPRQPTSPRWPGDIEMQPHLTAQEALELEKLEQGILKTQPKPETKGNFDQWLDRAIEATNPGREQTLEGVSGAPVWVTKAIANGALRVLRAAIKRGRSLADAMTQAVEWLRYHYGETPGFDAQEAQAWLERMHADPNSEPAPAWHELDAKRKEAADKLSEAQGRVADFKKGGKKAPPEARQAAADALEDYREATRRLRNNPEYVRDQLAWLEVLSKTDRSDARTEEMQNISDELSQVPPSLLNHVYHEMQQRNELPQSMPAPNGSSSLAELTDWLRAHKIDSPKRSLRERMALAERAAIEQARARIAAWWTEAVENFKRPAKETEFLGAIKDWHLMDTKSGLETFEWAKAIRKKVSDPARRSAITVWLQAGGDEQVLRAQLSDLPEKYRSAWEAALKLTDSEKELAKQIQADWLQKLESGMYAGIIQGAHENYTPQIWRKPPKLPDGQEAGPASPGNWAAKLDSRDPFFYFHKAFHNYFDGIMAGGEPRTMDIGDLVGIYNLAFNKSLSSRALVKQLLDAKSRDGMPVVMVSGRAEPMKSEPNAPVRGYLVDARYRGKAAVTADGRPYLPVDHPSMKDWKWVERTPEGKPILVKGDMLIHPDHVQFMKNVLGKSWFQDYAVTRGLLRANLFLKQSKLALGTFHLATEAEHALSHTVNPITKDFQLDMRQPDQAGLVRGGLELGMSDAHGLFMEGASSQGGLFHMVPGLGELSGKFSDWLFKDYIPALKMKMALHALERNRARYSKELTADQIYQLTGNQANAAFGAQNYRLLGRNPTLMDIQRICLLAPDFLISRMKFVGQALKPYGAEQRRALLIMAGTMYVGARILNSLFSDDNDPHWEPENAFSLIYKGRKYSLRTVVQDAWHMFTDPRSFWYNRVSPVARLTVELATSRDWRGIKRSSVEQLQDFLSWFAPVGAEGLLPGHSGREVTPASMAQQSIGIMSKRYTAATELSGRAKDFNRHGDLKAREWQKQRDQETLPESAYRKLDTLLEMNDLEAAKAEYDELVREGHKPASMNERYRHWQPFTGSMERERGFQASLSAHDQQLYRRAQADHSARYARFRQMFAGRGAVVSP